MTETIEHIDTSSAAATNEYRVFGPPGTGKTTYLSRQIAHAAETYGGANVLITSFSRAAAAELGGRDLPIPSDRLGTLHAHCYRALGMPELAESKVKDWNDEYPHWKISGSKKERMDGDVAMAHEDEDGGKASGDEFLEAINRWRGMMIPAEGWPMDTRHFWAKWSDYKQRVGLADFTDLIETALNDITFAPGYPKVIFSDESQDLNKMQLSLVRKWGAKAEYFIVAADDDQTIYTFTGATPDAVLDPPLPEDRIIVLKQSFRVPRAVHAHANQYIQQVGRRQQKEYLPRDFDGVCAQLGSGTWMAPEPVVDHAAQKMEEGKSCMFLASCSYQLGPLIKALRQRGLPFWNPYRKTNGMWNPLRTGKMGSASNRVSSLLLASEGLPWRRGDLVLFVEWLQVKGVLEKSAKKWLTEGDPAEEAGIAMLAQVFQPFALESLIAAQESGSAALVEWWQQRLLESVHARATFPATVALARGMKALHEEPRLMVGTIHSVKGGQADVVYLFPDLSRAGMIEYDRRGAPRDSITRQFYVGMTRAREELYFVPHATSAKVCLEV